MLPNTTLLWQYTHKWYLQLRFQYNSLHVCMSTKGKAFYYMNVMQVSESMEQLTGN
jgi:hypothetical protein